MYIYRPHRGGLAEAYAERKEFETEESMLNYIAQSHDGAFDVSDIVIDSGSVEDARIGWMDTRRVCVKRYGSEVFEWPQCIGFCATVYVK